MREETFKMERPNLVKAGEKVKIIERPEPAATAISLTLP